MDAQWQIKKPVRLATDGLAVVKMHVVHVVVIVTLTDNSTKG